MSKKISFFVGFILLLAVTLNIILWIVVSSSGMKNFEESVTEYVNHFPPLIAEPVRLTLINILLLIISIVCFVKSARSSHNSFFKLLCNGLIILSSILAFWNLFSLM